MAHIIPQDNVSISMGRASTNSTPVQMIRYFSNFNTDNLKRYIHNIHRRKISIHITCVGLGSARLNNSKEMGHAWKKHQLILRVVSGLFIEA